MLLDVQIEIHITFKVGQGQNGWILEAGNKTHQEHPWDARPGLKSVVSPGKQ